MPKPMVAGIYCRISLDKKLGTDAEGEGVERQRRECMYMCDRNGWAVHDVYIDNSVSAYGSEGRASKTRPEYDRMIRDFKAGRIDVIVAWKLDRLTRSMADYERMAAELKGQGLCICAGDFGGQAVDLADRSSNFIVQVMVAAAQFESARKGDRQKAANLDRAARGIARATPVRAYGYTHGNEVISEEAAVVKRIYEAYDKGTPMNAITRALRGESEPRVPDDFPTATPVSVADAEAKKRALELAGDQEAADKVKVPDRRWTPTATARVLRNPKYAGYMVHMPVPEDGSHVPLDSSWADYIVRDDHGGYVRGTNFAPLVDEDLWWRVQRRRDANLKDKHGDVIKGRGVRVSVGTGVYRCGVCGKPMITGGKVMQHGKDYGRTYRCPGHVCRMAAPIDAYVIGNVRAFLAKPELADVMAYAKGGERGQLAEIKSKIAAEDARIARIQRDYDEGLIEAADLKRNRDAARARRAALEDERARITATDAGQASVLGAPDPLAAFDRQTDPARISRIIDMLCEVTVDPHPRGKRITEESLREEVHITWKLARVVDEGDD